jgi:tetratricopeptide (TPR) repeat protein
MSSEERSPESVQAPNSQDIEFHKTQPFLQSEKERESASLLDSNTAQHHEHLGNALLAEGRTSEAVTSYQRAIGLDPHSFQSLLSLARIMHASRQWPMAEEYFRRASEINPASFEVQIRWATALLQTGGVGKAEEKVRLAIDIDPENFRAYEVLGEVLQRQGRFEEAVVAYEQALSLDSNSSVNSFQGIVASKKIVESDRPLVERMVSLSRAELPSQRAELVLVASIGKALDDLQDYKGAIEQFGRAREIAKSLNKRPPFDRDAAVHTVDTNKDLFTKAVFDRYNHGIETDLPVFIVGMPRSGTTLLEQVLSSHPEVGAGGELPFWRQSRVSRNPETALQPAFATEEAINYRRLLRSIGPKKRRVTDKMPINYALLGSLHVMFPNARIIHCRRHPVDTCLSILMNTLLTAEPPSYIFEPDDTVFFYRQYLRLMSHWREVLPSDRFLEVDYEELVVHGETTTRKIIGFCGLEWNEACLSPELNEREVSTPSKWQVRQPIYSSSVERWRRYEPWLGPYRDLLSL